MALLKKLIFLVNFFFEIFFIGNTYKFCYENICRKLLPIFLQNILYKTLFTKNFVRNNYPQKNCWSIKILRKNSRKKSFLVNFFNKFTRKISYNMKIFSSVGWESINPYTSLNPVFLLTPNIYMNTTLLFIENC